MGGGGEGNRRRENAGTIKKITTIRGKNMFLGHTRVRARDVEKTEKFVRGQWWGKRGGVGELRVLNSCREVRWSGLSP